MYQITSGETQHIVDSIVYIKLNPESGCYVICDQEEAEGVCVKAPVEMTDKNGTFTTCEDMVFAIKEGGLNGTEAVCQISAAQVAVDYFEAKKSAELLSLIEEVL